MRPRAMEDSLPSTPDYSVRRGEISAYGRALASSKRLRWLVLVAGCMQCLLLALLVFLPWPIPRVVFLTILLALVALLVISLLSIHQYTKRNFIEPDLAFRMWLQQVCDGELDATIGLDKHHRHYKELNFHTRNLASSLRQLSDDMDSLVESQTMKLSEQKRVLELLFKLTADLSSEPQGEVAFVTVCDYLAEWFEHAQVSCYRVVNNENLLRCVANRFTDGSGNAPAQVESDVHNSLGLMTIDRVPRKISSISSANGIAVNQLWVPFFGGEHRAGVLVVERESQKRIEHSETQRVLTTVSEQLSLLCGQQLVREQVLQTRLNRDRNELAAEIHDSLAQTLLALRYQITLLSEKIKSHQDNDLYQDVKKIYGSIEEANEEVRGLIREHRNPLSEHRYADALQLVIDQFSQANNIDVFFQSDDPQIRFTPREESMLQRIIGEALNNAAKYADASMIRVYLQVDASGVRRILVEDDGVGFQQPSSNDIAVTRSPDNGEQIGLTIMRERALSIGANLTIDSELGEGTRVSITMPPLIEVQRDTA